MKAIKRICMAMVLAFCAFAEAAQTNTIAIKAGKVVEPESGKTSKNQSIWVEGKGIKEIGANIPIASGAKVIDLSRSTVFPGMYDAHTHLCLTVKARRDAGHYFFTTLLDTTAYRAIEGVANAKAMLESGFTGVRDVGNAGNYADTDLRRAIERGAVPGPTIVNAGIIIAPYGGPLHRPPSNKGPPSTAEPLADSCRERTPRTWPPT